MRKTIFGLILIVTLISCEADPLILEEGLYYDGSTFGFVHLLIVDEWGELSIEYIDGDSFLLEGFAYHAGIAGAPWITHADFHRARYHLDRATTAVKLYYDDNTGVFYILNQQITEDWLAVLAEAEKYRERVFVPNRARPGEIVLTEEGDADPSLIKKITVVTGDSEKGAKYDNLVGVKGKELHLLEPHNYARGVDRVIKVDLAKGDAALSLIINLFVAGLAPL